MRAASLSLVSKKSWRLPLVSTAAYSLVWTQWYTSNMSNAIMLDTMALFALGSTLVYMTARLRTKGMERNEVRPPVSRVVVYIPCSKVRKMVLRAFICKYAIFFGVL